MSGAVSGAFLRGRIEGFGNNEFASSEPSADTTSNTFADGLWKTLQEDVRLSHLYDSAKATVESITNVIDETVSAIADGVEDTIDAVIGDDGETRSHVDETQGAGRPGWSDETAGLSQKPQSDDEEDWSGIDWKGVVNLICNEGNLEDFTTLVQAKVRTPNEEKLVGVLISQALLTQTGSDTILRVLYVIQAVAEAELPNAQSEIASRCKPTLEKLKRQVAFSKLATNLLQILPVVVVTATTAQGAAGTQEAQEAPPLPSSSQPPPADLLDMQVPIQKVQKPPAQVDLLDISVPRLEVTAAPEKPQSSELMDLLATEEPATTSQKSVPLDLFAPISSTTPMTTTATIPGGPARPPGVGPSNSSRLDLLSMSAEQAPFNPNTTNVPFGLNATTLNSLHLGTPATTTLGTSPKAASTSHMQLAHPNVSAGHCASIPRLSPSYPGSMSGWSLPAPGPTMPNAAWMPPPMMNSKLQAAPPTMSGMSASAANKSSTMAASTAGASEATVCFDPFAGLGDVLTLK